MSLGINSLPGPGLPTLNFTYRSIDRDIGIDKRIPLTDSTSTDNRQNTHTNNIMVNINHRFDLIWSHSLSGTFMDVAKKDKFSDRADDFVDPAMSTQVINISLTTRYTIPLKTSFNFTANSSELSTGPGQRGTQDFLTTNFDTEYPFFKNSSQVAFPMPVLPPVINTTFSLLIFELLQNTYLNIMITTPPTETFQNSNIYILNKS